MILFLDLHTTEPSPFPFWRHDFCFHLSSEKRTKNTDDGFLHTVPIVEEQPVEIQSNKKYLLHYSLYVI